MAGPWEKYAAQQSSSGPWSQYGPAPTQTQYQQDVANAPGVPKAPNAIDNNAAGLSNAKLGSSFSDVVGTIASHAKNMVAGPYHAVADAPSDTTEQAIASTQPDSLRSRIALAAYRVAAKPSVDAISQMSSKNSFDKNANLAMDAIPVVGPWARNIENDVQQKGAVAGLSGLATDVFAPKVAAKGAGAGLRAAGFTSRMASATPASRQLAITRQIVPGAPSDLLTRALKPSVASPDFEANVTTSMPDITAQNPAPGVKGFRDAANSAKDAANQEYQDIVSPYRLEPGASGPVRPGTIDGRPIADAQNASIPAIDRFESGPRTTSNPSGGIIERTANKASVYKRGIDIPTADDIRVDANAKLDGLYNKYGGDRAAAMSDPETARLSAVGNGVRNQLYPFLENNAGLAPGTVDAIQGRFGALSDVGNVAGKRATVFGRQNPLSLSETFAATPGHPIAGAVDFLGQRLLKDATGSDALVNSALDRFNNPTGTPLPAGKGFLRGAGMKAGNLARSAGKGTMKLRDAQNPLFYTNANTRNQ